MQIINTPAIYLSDETVHEEVKSEGLPPQDTSISSNNALEAQGTAPIPNKIFIPYLSNGLENENICQQLIDAVQSIREYPFPFEIPQFIQHETENSDLVKTETVEEFIKRSVMKYGAIPSENALIFNLESNGEGQPLTIKPMPRVSTLDSAFKISDDGEGHYVIEPIYEHARAIHNFYAGIRTNGYTPEEIEALTQYLIENKIPLYPTVYLDKPPEADIFYNAIGDDPELREAAIEILIAPYKEEMEELTRLQEEGMLVGAIAFGNEIAVEEVDSLNRPAYNPFNYAITAIALRERYPNLELSFGGNVFYFGERYFNINNVEAGFQRPLDEILGDRLSFEGTYDHMAFMYATMIILEESGYDFEEIFSRIQAHLYPYDQVNNELSTYLAIEDLKTFLNFLETNNLSAPVRVSEFGNLFEYYGITNEDAAEYIRELLEIFAESNLDFIGFFTPVIPDPANAVAIQLYPGSAGAICETVEGKEDSYDADCTESYQMLPVGYAVNDFLNSLLENQFIIKSSVHDNVKIIEISELPQGVNVFYARLNRYTNEVDAYNCLVLDQQDTIRATSIIDTHLDETDMADELIDGFVIQRENNDGTSSKVFIGLPQQLGPYSKIQQ